MKRTLSLRREVLAELADADLAGIAGGGSQTCASCLQYVSCHLDDCLLRQTFQLDCVAYDPGTYATC